MLSRNNSPQNTVDYFFEHSEWAKQRRVDCLDKNFGKKSIVVGNTRSFKSDDIENIKSKYDVDPNKEQILFWGVINTTRDTSFKALKTLREKTKDTHQIFYKCYPGEPYNQRFANQFNPFCVEGVTVIYNENDIYAMSEICDTHIAAASSVFNFAFTHNKKIVNLKTDYVLGFFGLIMQLGPIANWGLNIDKKTVEVDTEKFETNQKGIYAVGDICNYPGKLKLILSGFHEGALAARACFKLARPNEKYRFEFTTSSKAIKNRLGVKSD